MSDGVTRGAAASRCIDLAGADLSFWFCYQSLWVGQWFYNIFLLVLLKCVKNINANQGNSYTSSFLLPRIDEGVITSFQDKEVYVHGKTYIVVN